MDTKRLLLIVGSIAGTAIVLSGILFAYLYFTKSEDQTLRERMQEQLDSFTSEPSGCCLPQCGRIEQEDCIHEEDRWVETPCSQLDECEIGCCYPHGEMPREVCDLIELNTWQEGLCGNGFRVQLYTLDTRLLPGDQYGEYEMEANLYTCGEDPENAEWSGKWLWYWRVDGEDLDSNEGEITFAVYDGRASVLLGDEPGDLTVNIDEMRLASSFGEAGDVLVKGSVQKGSDECKD